MEPHSIELTEGNKNVISFLPESANVGIVGIPASIACAFCIACIVVST